MKHYKLVKFLSTLNVEPPCANVKPPHTNVMPPYRRLSGDGYACGTTKEHSAMHPISTCNVGEKLRK